MATADKKQAKRSPAGAGGDGEGTQDQAVEMGVSGYQGEDMPFMHDDFGGGGEEEKLMGGSHFLRM